MSLSNVFGILKQYAEGGSAPSGSTPEQDFEQVSQGASQSHLAGGLAEAFRSNQTPPFGQMLSTMFSNSNGTQQAGILNHLLGSLGPAASTGILGSLAGALGGGALGGGSQITPQQASQVPPEAVSQLAEQAQKNDPSFIDQASGFYAQHPTLVKALGAGSLAMIMSHMSRNS